MKAKQLIVWAVALLILTAVVVTAALLRERKPSAKSLLFFPGLTQSTCSSLLLASGADTVRVKRSGDVWMVAGREEAPRAGLGAAGDSAAAAPALSAVERDYPVDSATFAAVFEKLTTMKRDDLISQNVEKQASFEVDSTKGTLVRVWDEKGKLTGAVRIGRNGPDWSSCFVRMDGSNDVYLVSGGIKYSFTADKKRWRDRTIVRFAKATARKVSIAKKGSALVLEQVPDSAGAAIWSLTTPQQAVVPADKVEDLLNALSFFTCSDWETRTDLADTATGMAAPELTVTVELQGGGEKQVVVGRKAAGKDDFYVKTPEKPDVLFLVGSYNVSRLDKKLEDFVSKPAAPVPAAKKAPKKK